MRFATRIVVILTNVFVVVPAFAAEKISAEQIEFFEKHVRPLFVQYCHECHGPKKQEAGLRLDTHAGFAKGSDSGAVFVAGNSGASRLLQVLQYADGQTQMPPKGKLSDDQITLVRKWLEMGNPWPEDKVAIDASAKPHWSFQSVKRPEIPVVPKSIRDMADVEDSPNSPIRSPIDSFIAAALIEHRLSNSSPASRATWIRRVTLDLWGIPPTFDEVLAFAADDSLDAFERLVDRLLASPLYGQRWGRHWLDVARYADSKGYVFTAEPRYPYSYTYRDYVVDALNADTPFDQFVTEQLAADMVLRAEKGNSNQSEAQDSRLAALGFLTVGRRYLNNEHDIIDDRIDVVSRGLLGLTVGCARCHDHKFDPIPTSDYYSLYGVFSSTTEPTELPIIGSPKSASAYRTFQAELANREAAVLNYEKESVPKLMDEVRELAGDSLQQIAKQSPVWAQTPVAFTGSNEPRAPIVRRWQEFLNRTAPQSHSVMEPWHRLSKVAKVEDFPVDVTKLVESWTNAEEAAKVNPLVRQAIMEQKPNTLLELARTYGKLLRDTQNQWTELRKLTPEASQLPDAAAEQLRHVLYGDGSPAVLSLDEARQAFGRDVRDKITNLKRQVDSLKVTSPGAPPRAMVLSDAQIREPVIFIRGNPGRHGKTVPRQFLEAASGHDRKPFTNGSGRRELAEAIVDPRNPLTARVIVNRIWQHHFGIGIVPTSSDFGTRGLPPSNSTLLDWMAAEMLGLDQPHDSPNRWSLKWLHRTVLTSSVFRQSSSEDAEARGIDPENRMLWRMPRQRLDFESMRDSMLAVSAKLDDTIGGQPFDGVMNPTATRRTIYAMINRNDLPGVFRVFDFADTDSSAADRPQTTVPQQSLFALNSPFVVEQARRLAVECQTASNDDSGRLQRLYQRILLRQPSANESEIGLRFLRESLSTPTEKLSPLERLAQVLLITNEFIFVD